MLCVSSGGRRLAGDHPPDRRGRQCVPSASARGRASTEEPFVLFGLWSPIHVVAALPPSSLIPGLFRCCFLSAALYASGRRQLSTYPSPALLPGSGEPPSFLGWLPGHPTGSALPCRPDPMLGGADTLGETPSPQTPAGEEAQPPWASIYYFPQTDTRFLPFPLVRVLRPGVWGPHPHHLRTHPIF